MIDFFRYALPLVQPVASRVGPLAERAGILIRLTDGRGRVGWGDVAPWPGLSRESLDQALAELKIWRKYQHQDRSFTAQSSAVAFGVESVAAEWEGRLPTTGKIPVNGLLSDEPLATALPALLAAGFRTLKIKVGRQTLRADAERVQEIRRQVGAAIHLRLDANRAWALPDAIAFGRLVADTGIEYIEEPVRTPEDISTFHECTGLAVAVDESLLDQPLTVLRGCHGLKAVVIKPTVLGGLHAAARLAESASALGLTPVFSAVYESGVGIRMLARLAAQHGHNAVAMGLDTYRCLAADVLQPQLSFHDGALDLTDACRAEVHVAEWGAPL